MNKKTPNDNLMTKISCSDTLSSPTISVVTITFNNLDNLRKTFLSVVSQYYPATEYIIIDGGSSDNTVNFLCENDHLISSWVSEPDQGIYDAMNKGASIATGEWIIFMNAGDTFFSEKTLTEVAPYLNASADVVYGGFEGVFADRYQTWTSQCKPRKLSLLWREMPTCHQSILIKKDLQCRFKFDTSLTWCADHQLLIKLYAAKYSFKEIPICISKFDASGGNERDILIYTKERWHISRYLLNPIKRHAYFLTEYIFLLLQKKLFHRIRNTLPFEWIIALRRFRGLVGPIGRSS